MKRMFGDVETWKGLNIAGPKYFEAASAEALEVPLIGVVRRASRTRGLDLLATTLNKLPR